MSRSEGAENGGRHAGAAGWGGRATLVTALAFGAAAGLLETVPVAALSAAGETVRMSRHFVWMTPVADVALFLAAGLVLAGLGSVWQRARSRPLVIGTFAGLAALCLLLLAEPVHDLASLVLAAGVGVQVGRRSRGVGSGRPGRPTLVAAVLLPALIGGLAWWSFSRDTSRERSQLAEASEASVRADAPNVLLLILDTVRAGSLGLYGGSPWTGRRLEGLAGRGVVFDRAIAAAPWTLPSHAAMFTGHWPHRLAVGWSPLGPGEPTLAEILTAEGYATAGFVGNTLYASRASGLDRGFGVYEDYPVGPGQIVLSSSVGRAFAYNESFRALIHHHELLNRQPAGAVNRDFLEWLDGRGQGEAGRPWFAFLNYYDAHEPYFPPDSVLGGRSWNDFGHRGGLLVGGNAWVDKETITPTEAPIHGYAYHLAVTRADEAAGRLVDALERRGLLENTLVVIASDHGELLGEHGLFGHTNSLYMNTLHVPLLLLWPERIPAGIRVPGAVSLRDLPATILDLVGSEAALPGQSLRGTWHGEVGRDPAPAANRSPAVSHLTHGPEPQPNTPIGRGQAMQSIVEMPYHYIHNGDGTDAVYDLRSDPHEMRNLAGTPAGDSALVPLRAELYEIITGNPPPPEMPIDPYRPDRERLPADRPGNR